MSKDTWPAMRFDTFFDAVTNAARVQVLNHGEHTPQFCFLTEHGIVFMLVPVLPDDFDERHLVVYDGVKQMKQHDRLLGVAFCSEAWSLEVSHEAWESNSWERPRDSKRRIELLTVVGRDCTGVMTDRMYAAKMLRLGSGDDGKVYDLLPMDMDGMTIESSMLDAAVRGWSG
jgi:hypothetical protein